MSDNSKHIPDTSQGKRPNLILILADDMGFSDIGCYGSEIRTPHLDRMASEGVRFSQFYNCARCCPTRASLLTGQYPHKAGIGHMVSDDGLPGYRGFLNDRCVTLGEALHAGGYQTFYSGKWHVGGLWPRHDPSKWVLGNPNQPLAHDRGFDHSYICAAGGGSYFNPKPLVRDGKFIEIETDRYYTTDAYTDEALEYISQGAASGKPFFLHLCYQAPHWPLHALPEDIARYENAYLKGWDHLRTSRHEELKGTGLIDRSWKISKKDDKSPPWDETSDKEWQASRMAVYAAQVDRMDQNIGRVRAHLEKLGIAGNTLVVFLSDNGGCAEFLSEDGQKQRELPFTRDGRPVRCGNVPGLLPGDADTFSSYDLPWANASNSPFRLFKHWVHEGGISTPLIAWWPGRIAPKQMTHEVGHVMDIMPTFLELSGVKYPRELDGREVASVDGESLAPLLEGRRWTRQHPVFFEHEGNCAVRDGKWKLVRRFPGPWELYDMEVDRTETKDLSGKNPAKVAELATAYEAWAPTANVVPWDQLQQHRKSKRH
ncbi:MAG TPA: arylsulfatase [Lentisphaeria bacterium]|nr:MAG: arylsulfatase [Lentisphaerae bacterium GWF2_50_93]HCE43085.1 arylsulfatase [Lentisphaeria bacterium]